MGTADDMILPLTSTGTHTGMHLRANTAFKIQPKSSASSTRNGSSANANKYDRRPSTRRGAGGAHHRRHGQQPCSPSRIARLAIATIICFMLISHTLQVHPLQIFRPLLLYWHDNASIEAATIASTNELILQALAIENSIKRLATLQAIFDHHGRLSQTVGASHLKLATARIILQSLLEETNLQVRLNEDGGIRYTPSYHLPPLVVSASKSAVVTDQLKLLASMPDMATHRAGEHSPDTKFYQVHHYNDTLAWQDEWNTLLQKQPKNKHPATSITGIDYTDDKHYMYPNHLHEPPAAGGYPALKPLREMLHDWPQNQDLKGSFVETLQHFDYRDLEQRAMAQLFRDAELPFKMTRVPDLQAARRKWTDEYLTEQFDTANKASHPSSKPTVVAANQRADNTGHDNTLQGFAQESPDHFFVYFSSWNLPVLGLPPIRHNDWTFQTWAEHAVYADSVQLAADRPHFYYQAGTNQRDRYLSPSKQTFLTRDLNLLGAKTDNLFVDNAHQDGIQCRFGERGVVTSAHEDEGRNMVGMVTGAKRYILSPPNQCGKLGVFSDRHSPLWRHSLLNFGHLAHLEDDNTKASDMSSEERNWLERAGTSQAVETVLKEGEVLYIPSHWFHYIESLQKSAVCNVRSGVDKAGTKEFGGLRDVVQCQVK